MLAPFILYLLVVHCDLDPINSRLMKFMSETWVGSLFDPFQSHDFMVKKTDKLEAI